MYYPCTPHTLIFAFPLFLAIYNHIKMSIWKMQKISPTGQFYLSIWALFYAQHIMVCKWHSRLHNHLYPVHESKSPQAYILTDCLFWHLPSGRCQRWQFSEKFLHIKSIHFFFWDICGYTYKLRVILTVACPSNSLTVL